MRCPAEPWDKPTATEGFSRAGTQLHCTQRGSLFHSSGARQRCCQVSEPKRHNFFANTIGTSKQTKFSFHLHEQAPDQKKHLKFF